MVSILQLSALLCLLCSGLGAKPAVGEEEDKADLLSIPGMTEAEDGTLLFHDEVVKSVTGVGTGKKIKLPHGSAGDSSGEGEGYRLPPAYKEDNNVDVMKKETDVGWDPSNKVEKITPIKSMTELKSVQEITKMTPVKWIEEITSMNEVKSIEEIKEKIAREFIRKHGLKNLIGGDENHMEGENGPKPYVGLNADTTVEDTNDNMDIIEDELKTLENEIQKDEEICDEMTSDVERLKVKIATFAIKKKPKFQNIKD